MEQLQGNNNMILFFWAVFYCDVVTSVKICNPREFKLIHGEKGELTNLYRNIKTKKMYYKKVIPFPEEEEEVELGNGETVYFYDFEPYWLSYKAEVTILSALKEISHVVPPLYCASASPDISYSDYENHAHKMYTMTEYVPWLSLEQYFSDHSDPEELRKVIKKLVQSIYTVHSFGVVHLNIQPDKILTDGENVRILDFGSSVAPSLGIKEDIHCKYNYPFSAREMHNATSANDWNSLGVTAHFCRALQLFGSNPLPSEEEDLNHFISTCTETAPTFWDLMKETYLK